MGQTRVSGASHKSRTIAAKLSLSWELPFLTCTPQTVLTSIVLCGTEPCGKINGVITDLGALPGVNSSAPVWISDNGLIAGISENGLIDPLTGFPQLRAVLWNRSRSIVDLGTLGGNSSMGLAANSRGQVVGVALNAIGENPDFAQLMTFFLPAATQARAFRWQNGFMQDLGTLGGNDAAAWGMNQSGQIVGLSFTNTTPNDTTGIPTVHPFLWQNGTMEDLGSLGGTLSIPGSLDHFGGIRAVNESGKVAGTSTLAGDEVWHAFVWSNGNNDPPRHTRREHLGCTGNQ